MFNLTLGHQQTCWWIPKMDHEIRSQGPEFAVIWHVGSTYAYYIDEQLISWSMVGSIIIENVIETMTIKLLEIY